VVLSEVNGMTARGRFLAALSLWGLMVLSAQPIGEAATGTFTFGSAGNVTSFPYNGTAIPNVTIGDLTKVGATSSSSSGNFRASNWALDGSPVGGLTGAPDLGKYFQFTITADTGFSFDLDSLTFGFGRSSTGPRSSQWRSSIDNYAAPISSYSSLGTSGLFSQSAGALSFIADTDATSGTNVVLDLAGSSAGYRGLSTVGLRWYGYHAEATGGTGGFQGPLSFAVTVASNQPVGPDNPPIGSYDPPIDYYATATGTGAALKAQLNEIIDDHVVFSYNEARSILQVTDADPATPGNMLLVYDRVSLDVAAINPGGSIPGWDNGISWNREHTWPDSRGLGGSGPDYSDLHHLRPATPSVNSSRGNKNFGGAYGQPYGAVSDGGNLWYPGDADAGMIARHEFYMATRYDGADALTIDLELFPGDPSGATGLGSLTRMVEWHYQAVPGEFELRRNQIIYSDYQRNRNPYIDRPEFVWSVFVDQENDSQLHVGSAPAADGGSTLTVDLGRVIVGGEVPAAQNVTLHHNGFDGTYFEVTASAGATSSITGRFNAFPINSIGTAARTLAVGLDASTATAGPKSGTVTITNLDVTTEGGAGRGGNDADDVITTSFAVLSHATPSFLGSGTSSILTLDFGTLVQGDPTSTLSFDIFNLAGGLGSEWTAALDLDSIVKNDPAGVFSSTISPFAELAAESSTSVTVSMSTALLGSFSGSLLLNLSDEDLPGATTSSMTVSVQGAVVVPEPAGMVLAAVGLLVVGASLRTLPREQSRACGLLSAW
jgi:endonuclease I